MDKPRHPKVARPWKTQVAQKSKFTTPFVDDPRHLHTSKLEVHWKTEKTKEK